jgi:hypothetical protein
MSKLLAGPLIVLALCSCAQPHKVGSEYTAAALNAVNVCEVLAGGRDFAGKRIYVSGLYANDPQANPV